MPEKAPAPAQSGSPWLTGHRFADGTRAKHATVHALLAAGHSRRSIQRQLGMTMRALWEGQTSRHGAQTAAVPETLEAARASVHLAATLVQWFISGAVVRTP